MDRWTVTRDMAWGSALYRGMAIATLAKCNIAMLTEPATMSDPTDTPDSDWKRILTPAQYEVLRREGTERAFSSPLNDESRKGTFVCAGCGARLFASDMKFDSGTGWPSFFTTLPDAFQTKRDWKLIIPRTEYHCARCGGHHGHVFEDGPQPTGLRYCNNGVALRFVPDEA
jgi:peptide-methionine (R)-S-oxide reductase